MIVKGLSLLIPENHIETAPFLKEILSNIQVGRGLVGDF
jgi:hypothetical protein